MSKQALKESEASTNRMATAVETDDLVRIVSSSTSGEDDDDQSNRPSCKQPIANYAAPAPSVVMPPVGYYMPPYQHHTQRQPVIPFQPPHAGYNMMVPSAVIPYHPQQLQQHHPLPAQAHPAYSYARRTILPKPKKLYGGKDAISTNDREVRNDLTNSEKGKTRTKANTDIVDGASLLLEAARVQQARQEQKDEGAKKEAVKMASPVNTASSSVPPLVSEEQENRTIQQRVLVAPSVPPPMVVPYRHPHHQQYRHPYPPPLPQHPAQFQQFAFQSLQQQKMNTRKAPNNLTNKVIKAKHTRAGKGKWTEEEDNILRSAVTKIGAHKWSTIAELLPGREGKHCRNRWYHHLSPLVNKKSWSLQEDYIILQMHQTYGNRWSVIARQLEGRTDNSVKNRFNASMKNKIEAYLMCLRGLHNVAQDDQGRYFYGNDLEGCLWAIRGPPNTTETCRTTLGTKMFTSTYFRAVQEWSEKWKTSNADQIAHYKKALPLIIPSSTCNSNQHPLQPLASRYSDY